MRPKEAQLGIKSLTLYNVDSVECEAAAALRGWAVAGDDMTSGTLLDSQSYSITIRKLR